MLLQIEQKQIGPDITLIELAGKLALGRESQRIESVMEELSQTGKTRVILDMTKVDYIDSAGIGLVALVSGKLKQAGGKMVIVAPEGRVQQMLHMTQIDALVGVHPTLGQAASALGAATA